MKNSYITGLLVISFMLSAQNQPEISSNDVSAKQKGNILNQAMQNFKTALHRWRTCLVTHEGCTPQDRELVVEATNVLIERILLETVYTGATIGERLTKIKNKRKSLNPS